MRTLRDLDVRGRRVLLRVDFNVPLRNGAVADDTRIRAALPTIEELLDGGASIVLCSHLGRPGGKTVPSLSLGPIANHLSTLLGRSVAFVDQTVGHRAQQAAEQLRAGELLLLENTRFQPQEKQNDPEFATALAALADIFVNDAFGTAHRAHASTEGVAHYLPSAAGLLIEREMHFLQEALDNPERPFVAILGGAKISDKIGVVHRLLARSDLLLVGGGMANTFLAAGGVNMQESLVEPEVFDTASQLLEDGSEKLQLPEDAVAAQTFSFDANTKTVPVNQVPEGWRVLDIGPRTLVSYSRRVREAQTIVWNGPMGVFELEPFAVGTRGLAKAVAESGALSIVGGGDSVAAVRQAGLESEINHLSTGGGAALGVLEGKDLPGLAALEA